MRHLSSIYGNGSVRGESMENKHSVTMDKSNSIARTNKNKCHFAYKCSEPKKVYTYRKSLIIYVCSQALVANTIFDWGRWLGYLRVLVETQDYFKEMLLERMR